MPLIVFFQFRGIKHERRVAYLHYKGTDNFIGGVGVMNFLIERMVRSGSDNTR